MVPSTSGDLSRWIYPNQIFLCEPHRLEDSELLLMDRIQRLDATNQLAFHNFVELGKLTKHDFCSPEQIPGVLQLSTSFLSSKQP